MLRLLTKTSGPVAQLEGANCRNQEVGGPSHVTILAKRNAAWPSNCITGAKPM